MRADCIAAVGQALGRTLSRAEADAIEERVRYQLRALAAKDPAAYAAMSTDARLRAAGAAAGKQLVAEANEAARRTGLNLEARERIASYFDDMKARGHDPQDALDRLLFSNADGKSRALSLEDRVKAVQADYVRRLNTLLEASEPRVFGLMVNADMQKAIVRELFGEDTGNKLARDAARNWLQTMEPMRAQYRDVGGVLHTLEDWRFPQGHDQTKVFEAGAEQWIADIMPGLDRTRYVDEATGRQMNDVQLRALLEAAHETIASGGANKKTPGEQRGSGSVATRLDQHRVLHFRDAEGYLAYQEKYGNRDLYSTMLGHVRRMSRSIALMEQFGPDADRTFRWANDTAHVAASKTKPDAEHVAKHLEESYRFVAGASNGIASPRVAKAFDDVKNVMSSAKLGSAVVSSIPDLATMQMTASYNRLPLARFWKNVLGQLNPAAAEDRRFIERAGIGLEDMITELTRFGGDQFGPGWSSRLASANLKISGMGAWTSGLRRAFGSTMMHTMASLAERHATIGAMHESDARILQSKGVTEDHFKVWKAATPSETKYGRLLTADSIYQAKGFTEGQKREAAQALLSVVLSESHMAVIEPGARERMLMDSGRPRGELRGEIVRSFWQFKSYPFAMIRKHIVERGLGADTLGGKITYLAPLMLATTALGALAMEVDDMLRGKDPRPLYGADGKAVFRNWVGAFVKGGSLGMYGDFLASTADPSGRDFFSAAAGPLAGLVNDAGKLTLGNAVQALAGKETHFGGEFVRFARGITPGANLWWAKAVTDHAIFNQAIDSLQPGYLARVESRARREFGQSYYWRPQDTTPERGPNLGNLGGRQ